MPVGRDSPGRGKAVALLATSFVVVGGGAACTLIALVSGADPTEQLGITLACFAGIVLLLWLLRDRDPANQAAERWAWLARRKKVPYRLEPRVRPDPRAAGTRTPPSVESVRELTGGQTTWVPARGTKRPRDADAN
jgi:hypothetical protein